MKTSDWRRAVVVGLLMVVGGAMGEKVRAAEPLLWTDFESEVGGEWSLENAENSVAVFTRFSGRFGNQNQTLTLSGLTAGEMYTLRFDLYLIDSWDGGSLGSGDTFRVLLGDGPIFAHTFSQFGGAQTYPLAPDEQGMLGFGGWNDSIFRRIEIPWVAPAAVATLTFQGQNLQGLEDESWGLDNVGVWRSSEMEATEVVSSGLPASGASVESAIDRVTVEFTRALLSASATNGANYEVRGAGLNGLLGDADDVGYAVTGEYVAATKRVVLRLAPDPLPAGLYRFRTLAGLRDANDRGVTPWVRDFSVMDPVLGRIEGVDNGTLPLATPLPVAETPVGLGFYTGYGMGTLSVVGDADYWRFEAEAGDRVTVHLEANDRVGVYPRLNLRNAADAVLVNVQGGYSDGVARVQDYVVAAPGTYYLRVWSDHAESTYRLRLDQARKGDLETEDNGTRATADGLSMVFTSGALRGQVAGALSSADGAGDYHLLGRQNPGNQVALTLASPEGSSLVVGAVNLTLERSGAAEPMAAGSEGTLNHAVVEDDDYYVRLMTSERGVRAQYVLQVAVNDATPPRVLSVSLPGEGEILSGVLDRFTVGFSEDMLATSVNEVGHYELRGAGVDGVMGTSDDVIYAVAPQSYVSGLSATYLVTDGPLQPGLHRWTMGTGLKDRAGNPLTTPLVRNFTVQSEGPWIVENRDNGVSAKGTALGLTGTGTADGSLAYQGSLASGNNPYYISRGDLNGDGRMDLVAANYGAGTVSVWLGNGDGSFGQRSDYPAGNGAIAVDVGDADGDGKLDVVVANHNTHTVGILLGAGDGTLGVMSTVAVGNNPREVKMADLDGDGTLELVVANSGQNYVTVLRRGEGGSYTRSDFVSGQAVWSVAVGDVTGDGKLDVVSANHNAGTVSVLAGVGDGSLEAAVTVEVGNQPRSVAMGDLDGDGRMDVVVLNSGSRSLSVMMGQAGGGLGAVETVGGLGSDAYRVVMGDVDGNGRLDAIVAAYGSARLEILFNEGGVLGGLVGYEMRNPIGVVVGDWNGDGLMDVATASYNYHDVGVWLGNELRLLAEDPAGVWSGYGRGNVSGSEDRDYWSFHGRAGDVLSVAVEVPGSLEASGLNYSVRRPDDTQVTAFNADYNGRGQSEPVTLGQTGTYAVVVRENYGYRGEYRMRVTLVRGGIQMERENNNSVGQVNVPVLTLEEGRQRGRVHGYVGVSDGNGDYYGLGNLTVGTEIQLGMVKPAASPLSWVLEVYRGDGTKVAEGEAGATPLVHVVAEGADGGYVARVRAGANSGLLSQYVLDLQLTDTLAPQVLTVSLPGEGETTSAVVDRFTAGFSEDMLASSVNELGHYELRGAGVDGVLGTVDDVIYTVASQTYVNGLSATYLVTDGPLQPGLHRWTMGTGLKDRAGNALGTAYVRNFAVEGVSGWLLESRDNGVSANGNALGLTGTGTADGSLAYQGSLASGNNPYYISRGDLNGDGRMDLVSANHGPGTVSVWLGNWDGSFGSRSDYTAGSGAIAVDVGDVDGDGKLDVVVANYNVHTVGILLGAGDGTLGEMSTVAVGNNPREVKMADLDGDGTLELVVANSGQNYVTVLRRGEGGSYTRSDYESGQSVWSVAVGDVTGDGKLDVVSANHNAGTVSVLAGAGDGSLEAAVTVEVGNQPRSVAMGDLDGDGRMDVVVLNTGSRSLSVMMGQAGGGLGAVETIGGLGSDGYRVVMGDVDGNGRLDALVAAYGSARLEILYNEGGVLGGMVGYEMRNPIGVVVGDWNGDGRMDVATASYNYHDVGVWLGNELRLLAEDPTGVWSGYGRGNVSGSEDRDYWSFHGRAGDVLSVAVEVPGSPEASGLNYSVRRPDDTQMTAFNADYQGRGQSEPVVLGQTGTHAVVVRENHGYRGEYRMRVTLVRGGIQMERESNNSVGQVNVPVLTLEEGRQKGRVHGYVGVSDGNGDYYGLGNLTVGTEIQLGMVKPAASPLSWVLEVYRGDGTKVAEGEAGATPLVHVVAEGADGGYVARVRAGANSGLLSQYVLDLQLTDTLAPQVLTVSLPGEGETTSAVVDRFTAGFSEDMLASSVNESGHYELRGAGVDGVLGTADDVIYTVAPQTYASGLSATYLVTDGPLQAGLHRWTMGTGLKDRAGNALGTAYVRNFAVEGVLGWWLENRDNGVSAKGTALGLTGTGTADGSLAYQGSLASGNSPYYISRGDMNGDGRMDLVVANYGSGTVSVWLGNGDGSFGQRSDYPAGNGAIAVDVGDVDGDGKLDVVLANHNTHTVGILLGAGDGTLGTMSTVAVGNNPREVKMADLDGDGTPELVVANSGQNYVTVLRRGEGGSYTRSDYESGQAVWSVAVGDVTGDGKLDVVSANHNAGTVSVLAGAGDGSLGAAVTVEVGNQPRSVAMGDLDGDGRMDVVVLNTGSRSLSVMMGQAGGGLGAVETVGGLGSDAYRVVLGDVDGNGRLDAIVAAYGSARLEILFNEGGVLGGMVGYEMRNPIGVVVGDWNGDGRMDVATASYNYHDVGVWLGNELRLLSEDPAGVWSGYGRGNVSGSEDRDYWSFHGRAGDVLSVAVEVPGSPEASGLNYSVRRPDDTQMTAFNADYQGRGQSEPVVLGQTGTYAVVVRENHGYRGEYRMRVTLVRGGIQMERENNNSVGQVNPLLLVSKGLGTADAVVHGYVGVADGSGDYFGLGQVASGSQIRLALDKPVSSPLSWVLEIYREDGSLVAGGAANITPVVHVVEEGAGGIYVARVRAAAGAGVLAQYLLEAELVDAQSPRVVSVSLPEEGTAGNQVVDRFTVRFDEDLWVASAMDAAHYPLVHAGMDGVLGTSDDEGYALVPQAYGGGLTVALRVTDGPLQPGRYRLTVTTGVRDRSGNPLAEPYVRTFDLAAASGFVMENRDNGSPLLATPVGREIHPGTDGSVLVQGTVEVGGNPVALRTADFDGNGIGDLMVSRYGGGGVSVVLGNGDGTFRTPIVFATGAQPSEVAVGDVNGDGFLDWAVANEGPDTVTVRFGDGTGGFPEGISLSMGNNPAGLAMEDFNADGHLDVVTANDGGGNVGIRLGNGDGTFGELTQYVSGTNPVRLVSGRFDADAYLDLAVVNQGESTVSLLRGDGAGGFAAPVKFVTGASPFSVAAADLDGDGHLDLITGNTSASSLSVLYGRGDGTFEDQMVVASGAAEPIHVLVTDTDDDLRLDLVVAHRSGNRLSVLRNLVNRQFAPVAGYVTSGGPMATAVGDWNQDGRMDLATAHFYGNTLNLWMGQPLRRLNPESVGYGIRSGGGQGNLANSGDGDYWVFSGDAGDRVILGVDIPGRPAASQLRYRLMAASGEVLADYYPDYQGYGQTAPITLPWRGTYLVWVTYHYEYTGEYRLRLLLAPPEAKVALEGEPNSGVNNASVLGMEASGSGRVGAGLGYVQGSGDIDYYDLGMIASGETVFLNVRNLEGSGLTPVVSLYDAANGYQNEAAGGRAFDAVAEVRVTQAGRYYAAVRGAAGQGGLVDAYVVEAQVLPTESVAFPNLQITRLTVTHGAEPVSGDPVQVEFTVRNVGSQGTPVSAWTDRLVLSENTVYGDLDDITLGLIPRTSALAAGAEYTVVETVALPPGVEGLYEVIGQTDSGNAVAEFVFEADNITVAEDPIEIQRADYPDLRVESLAAIWVEEGIRVTWLTANRGLAPAPAEVTETVTLRHTSTGGAEGVVTRTLTEPLAVQGTLAGSALLPVPVPGPFAVQVLTDALDGVYEFDAVSHASAEQNNLVSVVFPVTVDLQVANLRLDPDAALVSGVTVTLTWDQVNHGNRAATGTWNDRVMVVNTTTGATLMNMVVAADAGAGDLAPGASRARSRSVNLPEGAAGVGRIEFRVTVDAGNQVAEFIASGNAEANNQTVLVRDAILGATADLVVTELVPVAEADAGHPVTVGWTVRNMGTQTAVGPWVDRILVSAAADGTGAQVVGQASFPSNIVVGAEVARTAEVILPGGLGSRLYLLVITDAGQAVVEANESNNTRVSEASTLVRRANLVVTEMSLPPSAEAGQPVLFEWTVENRGDGATQATAWADHLYLSTQSDGTARTYLQTVAHTNLLAAGEAVVFGTEVAMPAGATGPRYLVVSTDAGQQITESDETDNLTVSDTPVELRIGDLTVVMATAPPAAQLGEVVTVSYRLRNAGNAPVRGTWQDAVYFSTDNAPGGDVLLASRSSGDGNPLTAGGELNLEVSATLPASGVAAGTYYLLVRTDVAGAVGEGDEGNNWSAAIPINLTVPPRPDLVVVEPTVPAAVTPGQAFPVAWQVRNAGAAPASGAWRDTVYLSADGSLTAALALGTYSFADTLAPGAAVSRGAEVVVPVTAPVGAFRILVVTDTAGDVVESDETNNGRASLTTLDIPAVLTLQPNVGDVREGQTLRLTLSRTGSRAASMAITLTSTDTTELTVPQSVVIPAGQGLVVFEAQGVADGVVDGAQTVTVEAGATGFTSARGSYQVIDAEVPRLVLAAAEESMVEGASLTVVVQVPLAPVADLVVNLASSRPNQVLVPASVVIPAGSTGVEFLAAAVEDSLVEGDKAYELTASAASHGQGSMPLTVVDNDVPTVTLALNPVTVSEGDGTQASQLTVVRDPVSDRALQIRWQSGAAGVLLPPTTTLPAGQPSATLPVGIQDNVLVDGTREVTLRGDILESGTSTAVAATSAATLTILDEDGPTLRLVLERKLVGEGLTPATEGTVIRNTDSTAALTVTLTSSDTTELVVPATLVLPAGASLASFQANSLNDDQSDGNQTVVVTASAEGFSPGVDNLVVSDRDLPDLVVTVTEGPAVAVTDEWMPVTYRIQNQGVQPAGPRWTTRVFLSRDAIPGDDTLLGNYVFGGTIAPGLYFEQTVSVRMPVVPGNYWVVTQTDVGNEIGETLEDNNTRVSAQPIRVGPAYTATVATDLNSALAGTPVPMTGRALRPNGEAAPEGSLVNIHIYVRGTQRIISALVDRQGQFAVTWQPLAQEAGDYEIGAAHPGEAQAPVQDGFILVGMRADPAFGTLRVVEGGTVEGRVQFLNASTLPLTGLGLTVLEKPSNILLETELGAQVIPGTGQVALTFQVTATDASTPGGLIRFRVETTEGAFAEAAVGVTIEALRPKLAVVPGSLTAGMLRGETRAVKAQVSNTGGRPTGWLNVSLPSVPWLSVASLNPAPSLEPGESMEVTLLLAPPADLALGPYQGSLHVGNAEVGLQVPFTFRAVSDRLGDLKVEVVDEYTYYAEGSPKVAEATVTVRDPFTFDRVAEAVTSESGTVVFPGLVEGYYDVRITAAKHTGYQQNVLVEPGQENLHTAFVSRETVRYTWKVEPVEVEDHYKITIETEFETVVPAPVITVEPAVIDLGQITTGVAQVDIKVTNHGLIQADNFHLQFPTHPLWEFSPLIDEVGVLPARSSLTIPLTIRKVGGGPALSGATISGSGTHGGGPCHTSANATWELICGPFNASYSSTISMPNANSGCGTRPVAPGSIYGWAPGSGPSGPGTPGGGSVSGPSVAVKIVCDPKCLVLAGLGCVPGPVGCFFGGFGCGMGLGGGVSALTILDCAVAAAGCLIPPAAVPACIYAFMRCFIQPASGAALAAHEFRLYEYLHGRRQLGLASSADPVERFRPGVQSMLDVLGEVLGAPDQVWLNPSAGANTGDWYQRFLGMVTEGSDGGRQVTASEQAALLEGVQPPGVEPSEVLRMIARWNRTLDYWSRGVMGPGDVEPGESSDFIDFHALQAKLEAATAAHEEARQYGYNDPIEAIVETIRVQNDEGGEGGTCARIKLRLEQEAVITRDAFQATLEIDNQDVGDMTDIEIRVFALDAEGRDASDYFGLRPPTLSGLSAVDGSGRVGAGSTGSAKWLIIPTVDAAPDVPLTYYIAGEFAYAVGGTRVRIPLEPVSITVLPTPRLWMKYFHQRDVFSDDPFTDEVEPSLPYNLAVMVENRGQGSARNMRITSAEPQIVENEKGLLIDFKIIATEVAGQNLTPSLTVNLGDILPGQTVIGRWLMTSSLHGLFTDYKASFEHVDGLGNPRLSLIEDLSIHEMIRLVRAGGAFEDGKPDFFVNQVPDPLDLGDTLYLSSGETNAVERVDEATVVGTLAPDNLTLVVQAAMPNEWGYLRLPDPADGQYDLVWVERMDGTRVLADNVWVTDRTFVGLGKRPKREHLLHLLDHGGSGGYTLHYDALPVADAVSPISRVNNLPASTTASFAVSWQGQDNEGGTGIQYYDLWVSEDGGPAIVWLSRTPLTTALYSGEVGRRYAFYSRATDRAGNQESAPAAAQASTLVAFASAAPVLGAISDQTTDEDVPLTGLPVVVSDPDTPLDQLVFTVDSSNRTLLVPARVSLTGSGGDRILSLTPEGDRFGSTDITLTVSDGTHRDTRTFRVTVIPVNDPPVAGEDRMERSPFGRSKVSVSTLLTNDIDPESDDIRFVGVSPVSALGGQVVESGGWVFYTPPLGDPAPDSFTYTITDLAGATATGRVQVGLPGSGGTPELHVLSAERGPDGTIRVRLFGVPGRRYQIQVTDALPTATWTVLQEIEVGPNGLLILDDLEAVGQATRFYRAYSP